MKYIRTKDGIYEVIEECFKPMENNMVFIPREGLTKILKQTDTIEELIDEFVFTDSNNSFYQVETHNSICGKDIVCYGAIWTDKGLIYVAKMNDKGELELL